VQNICVYADQTKTKPIAIIVPVEAVLKKLASENNIEGDYTDIVHNPKLRSAVLKQMHTVGKKAGLAGIELIEGVVLSAEEWIPENVSWKPTCAIPYDIESDLLIFWCFLEHGYQRTEVEQERYS